MRQVRVGGQVVRLTGSHVKKLDEGGLEADIYLLDSDRVLKLFKPPDHPDYDGRPLDQQRARERIATHQTKLRAFPSSLPDRVVTPDELALDGRGQVVGYVMRYVRQATLLFQYGQPAFHVAGLRNETVVAVFQDLHQTVARLHQAGVVIGDFNDANVLVSSEDVPYLIDADSFQFGPFLTKVFTARFVDPTLCVEYRAPGQPVGIALAQPHNAASDWYAWTVMLMQSLLCVDPYGGVYKPRQPAAQLPHGLRPLQRITIFHPEVVYPKRGVPYRTLPDDLLQYWHEVFEQDRRGMFPRHLIDDLRWTSCLNCGLVHARGVCPECAGPAPASVKEVIVVRGSVTAHEIFQTRGTILHATHQSGRLRWLYHDQGGFRREDGRLVLSGGLDPQVRYRIRGEETLLAKGNQLLIFNKEGVLQRQVVDSYGQLPLIDANAAHRYWISQGSLRRNGLLDVSTHLGDVLEDRTLFWVGEKLGFGFYRAGGVLTAFVFDPYGSGLKDTVRLPLWPGQLIDSTAVFGADRVWFLTTRREGALTVNRCVVITAHGTVEATAEAIADDGSWLGTLRGKAAAGEFLLAATDDGVVRLETAGTGIKLVRQYPDTEPFVTAGSHLFLGADGLYVVGRQQIRRMTIRS